MWVKIYLVIGYAERKDSITTGRPCQPQPPLDPPLARMRTMLWVSHSQFIFIFSEANIFITITSWAPCQNMWDHSYYNTFAGTSWYYESSGTAGSVDGIEVLIRWSGTQVSTWWTPEDFKNRVYTENITFNSLLNLKHFVTFFKTSFTHFKTPLNLYFF